MCLAYSMKDIQKTGGMIIIMDKNKQDRLNKQMRFIEEIDKEIEDFYIDKEKINNIKKI